MNIGNILNNPVDKTKQNTEWIGRLFWVVHRTRSVSEGDIYEFRDRCINIPTPET